MSACSTCVTVVHVLLKYHYVIDDNIINYVHHVAHLI